MIYAKRTIMRIPIITGIVMMIVLFLLLSVNRENLNLKYKKVNRKQGETIMLMNYVSNALTNRLSLPGSAWATRTYRSSPPLLSCFISSRFVVQDIQPIPAS
jgi:putative effector of murein hydrolase LrgA (UPF0299 family)